MEVRGDTWGQDYVSLNDQAQVLFCRAAGLGPTKTHTVTGVGIKAIKSINERWLKTVKPHVLKKQLRIKFGDKVNWTQAEVDEVTLRGQKTKNGKRVKWFQYCGFLVRGDRRS